MAQNKPTPGDKGLTKEIGQSGTYLAQGYLSLQDYNTELTGVSGILIYDKMRKSDATVRLSLMALTVPILSGMWFLDPASKSAQDTEIKDFVEYNLLSGESNISWPIFQEEALKLMLAYGRMIYEKVFDLVEFNGKTYIGLTKLAPRHPRTVYRWAIGFGDQEQFGITQQLPTGPTVEIPGDKLVILTHEKEGDNYEGMSVLRSSYRHWFIKDNLYRIDAIKHERQGLGIPYAQAKQGFNPTDRERSLVQQALKNLRANENAFVEIPSGYDIGFMDMKGHTTAEMKDSIDHHDRQIVKNVMAQFLEIGGHKGSSGSFSASDNQVDLFVLGLQSVANYFCEAIQQSVVKQLVDLNWPGYGTYPKLKSDKIGPDNATKLADNLLKFVQAHIITPTDEDEEFIRDVMDMPALPENMEGTIDRSFQPVTPAQPPQQDDGKSQSTQKKEASEALLEVKKLRDEVLAVLHG